MCFHSMDRKALQALCKQHKIPANLSNAEMAKRLEDHLKDKEKSPQKEQTNGPDFQSMKRKDLQALCKQHQIPANLPNQEMAKRLTDILREKDKSPVHEPINVLDKTESTEMVLDYYSMKYKDLQMLCKKHSIPANLSKPQMAKRLTELIKENEKPSVQVLVNEHDENASETESMDMSMNRKVKKVRFSPEHELFEYTRSPQLKQIRRNTVSKRPSNLSVETFDSGLTNIENVDGHGRVTRSRGSNLVEEVVAKSKRTRRAVDIVDNVPLVSGEGDDNIVVTSRSFRNKGVPVNLIEPEIVKMATENVPQPITNEENEKNVPQPITRRSRRKTIITEPVASEEILETDVAVVNCETEKRLSTRRSRKAVSVCKSDENKDELGGDTIIQQKNMPKKRKRGVVVKTDDVRSSSKQSMEEGKNERSASVVEPQRPEFIRKTLREEQVVSIAESAEINFLDGNEEANSEENATLSFAELETDLADCEKSISASKTKESGKVDLFQFDVQDMVDKDITNMNKNQSEPVSGYEGFAEPSSATVSVSLVDLVDHAGEVEEVLVQENLDSVEHAGEVEEVLVQENLDSVEHVGEVEEVSVQENLDSVDHVGEVEEVSVQENLDSVDHVGEVVEVSLQENLDSVEHVSEVEEVSVQENLDSVETGETNVISLEITYHHNNVDYMEASNGISEDNKEDIGEVGAPESFADPEVIESEADTGTHPDLDLADDHLGEDEVILVQNVDHMEASNNSFDKEDGASEAGEFGTPESCDRFIYHTVSKSASQLKDTSSGNLRIIEGEGDDAETKKEECLNEHKIASDEDDEFGVADLFSGERSVMNASQDRGIVSGECSALYSDEQRVDKEYSTVFQKPISSITTKICTMRDLEADHSCREEICIDKSIEVAKTDAGGSLDCHENQEFVMSHILDVERRYEIVQQDSKLLSGENSVNRSDENGIEIKLKSSCEDDWISEGDKAENDENYENRKDEDTEFGVSNLFDVEKSFRVTPQDRGFFHAVESNKGFNESTMCDEVVIGAGSSSSKEISPSKPQSSSKSPGTDSVISDEYGYANIPDKEFSIAQGEEINNECTPKQAEQPKSPSAITTAITNTPMFMPQTCGKEITSPVAEGFNANEDGNDGNCCNDEDKLENACNTDADISMDCTVNFSGVETLCESESHHSEDTEYHQSPNLHAKPSQSLPEIEATVNDVTLNGLDDSMNKLNANSGNSLTNKENEMEEEKGSESAKSTCGGSSLPSNIEDNQLRWLFAMPSNINSLSEVEKTSRHGNELDRADLPITECVGTTKEDAVAQIKFDEIEFEKRSSSDTGGEINYEEVNVAESVDLVNTSGSVLSEASDEHLTEIDGEEKEIMSQGESCLYVEATENRVSELTEKIAFSSFGSQRNFDNVEHMDTDFLENLGSENIVSLKSERKLAQTIRAEFEFSDAHIQNPNVLEKNHHLTATKEDTNLSETLVDTTGTPSSLFPKVSDDDDEDVTDRKSEGGDGKTMTMDDVDDNLRSLPDFSDELHNNTLMAIFKSPSVANTLELQSTYKETSPTAQNVDYMLSAAGVPVCGAEDGNGNGDSEKSDTGAPLCNLGGDHEENSDGTEVSTKVQISMPGEESDVGTPVLNLEGDIEENDKETGEIVSVSEVEFPVSEEEQIDVPAAAFGCSEFLKECDVATTIKEYIDNELTCMDEMESGNSVAKEEIESSSRPVCPSVKENARTILIHGTPSKVVDMKENGAAYKSSNFGDFTAVRPAKRKALQDVKWK